MGARSSEAAKFVHNLQGDSIRFAEADVDGNNALTFEEFMNMQPRCVLGAHSEHEIRNWFNSADTNKNGTVSINEFFMWTLQRHALTGMESLRSAFDKYDKNHTGGIDMEEFQKMCDDFGFGAAAHAIFMDLDKDGSGVVAFTDVLQQLMSAVTQSPQDKQLRTAKHVEDRVRIRRNSIRREDIKPDISVESSADTKQLFMAMVWSSNDASRDSAMGSGGQGMDVSAWKMDANDVAGLVKQLRDNVIAAKASVSDLIELFNWEGGGNRSQTDFFDVTEKEFVKAMRERLRYTGPLTVLKGAFRALGGDDGKVEVDELFEFVTGRTNAMRMRQTSNNLAGLTIDVSSCEAGVEWTIEELRSSIQTVLIANKYAPYVLLNAWDVDGDHRLSKSEFLAKMKRLIVGKDDTNTELWYDSVRPAVGRLYAKLCDKKRSGIDLTVFGAFLNESWPSAKGESAPDAPDASLGATDTPKTYAAAAKRRDRRFIKREAVAQARYAPPQTIDMASPERRFTTTITQKARPVPMPLYASRMEFNMSSSKLRPPKGRPFSRAIWDGTMDRRWEIRLPPVELPRTTLRFVVSEANLESSRFEHTHSTPRLAISFPEPMMRASASVGSLAGPASEGGGQRPEQRHQHMQQRLAEARRLNMAAISKRYGHAGFRGRTSANAPPAAGEGLMGTFSATV